MPRLSLSFLFILLFLIAGCSGHSSRHANIGKIYSCPTTPCGLEIANSDMIFDYVIVREPSDDYIISGTMSPRGVPDGTLVDMAVLSFELARDMTIFDSFSFPIVGHDLRTPIQFKQRFTPSGGFDGIIFSWDVRYVE